MLAAHSLGLGNCYTYFSSQVLDNPEIVEALELKGGEQVFGPLIIGYADEFPESPPKKDPVVKWI